LDVDLNEVLYSELLLIHKNQKLIKHDHVPFYDDAQLFDYHHPDVPCELYHYEKQLLGGVLMHDNGVRASYYSF